MPLFGKKNFDKPSEVETTGVCFSGTLKQGTRAQNYYAGEKKNLFCFVKTGRRQRRLPDAETRLWGLLELHSRRAAKRR